MVGAICWNTQNESKEDLPERKLSRPQFTQMDTIEKQTLMESLADRYDMTFLSVYILLTAGARAAPPASSRKMVGSSSLSPAIPSPWAGSSLPGLNQESREELDYLFQEWEMEPQNPEEMIRESMAPRSAGRSLAPCWWAELEELCWEPVKMDDPRLTAHPDWLKVPGFCLE